MLRHILRNPQAKKNRGEEGQTLVEFALTLMTFLFVLVLVIEVGRILWAFVTIQHAARLGARYAVTGQWMEGYAVDPTAGYDATSDEPLDRIPPCWPYFYDDPVAPPPPSERGPLWYEPYRNPRTCSVEATSLGAMRVLPLDPDAPLGDPGYYAVVVKGVVDDAYPTTGTFERNGDPNNYYSSYYDPSNTDFDGDNVDLSRGFAGLPQQKVVVQIDYRLPIITPLLDSIAESVRLTATAIMTNEAYGGTGVQREAILPPDLPSVDPLPSGSMVDLIVSDIEILDPLFDPAYVELNEPFDANVTIRNQGTVNTYTEDGDGDGLPDGFDVVLYASDTAIAASATPPGSLVEIGRAHVASDVLSGQSKVVQIVDAAFSQIGGPFYLYAWVDAGNTVDETGTGSAADPVRELNNTHYLEGFTVVSNADLMLSKSVDEMYPGEGDTVTFLLRVTNRTANPASGIQVVDALPAGLTYAGATPSGEYSGDVWDIGTIPGNTSVQLQLSATVDAGTMGQTITNSAEVEIGGAPAGIVDQVSITVGATDIAVSKTVDVPFPAETNTISYEVSVTNDGPNDATGLQIMDQLPAGLTSTSATATDSQGGTWQSSTGIWNIGSLADGASVTLTIEAEVETGTAGDTITNTASLNAIDQPEVDQIKGLTGNNTASASVTVKGYDLQPAFDYDAGDLAEGSEFTYSVVLRNNSGSPAENITVDVPIPSEFINATVSGDGSYSSGQWTLTGPIPASSERRLEFTVMVDAPAGTTVQLTASAPTASDTVPANNTVTQNLVIGAGNADLVIEKIILSTPPFQEGRDVDYYITVSNSGPQDATDLQLTDILPAGLINIPATVTDSRGGTWNRDTGIWDIGTLTPTSGTVTLTIPATIDTGTEGSTITNTISDVSMNENDPVDANNDLEEALTVTPPIDLAIDKQMTTTGAILPGSGMSYTITVTNEGSINATGVQVREPVPASTTFSSANVTAGSYNDATGLWDVGSLAAGTSATLTLNVNVPSSTTPGTVINNTAEVYAAVEVDRDSTPNNGVASEDDQDSASVMIAEAFADIFVNLGRRDRCGDVDWGRPANPGELSTLPGKLNAESVTWVRNQQYTPTLGWGYTGSPNLIQTNDQIDYPDGSNANDSATRTLFQCQATGKFQFQVDNVPSGQYRVYLAFADPIYEPTERACWLWFCYDFPRHTFDVSYSIGGAPSLVYNEYNISQVAGGEDRLYVQTFTLRTPGNEPLVVYFEGGNDGRSSTEPLVQGIGIERIGD